MNTPSLREKKLADKYRNFEHLCEDMQEGEDFSISVSEGSDPRLLVIAPHAGKTERGTTELSRAIAGEMYSCYLFEGTRPNGNGDLHITSHHFDEPRALKALEQCDIALGIHGREKRGDEKSVWIGGLDQTFMDLLASELSAAGFETKVDGHAFPAQEPQNVCNRGKTKKGAQLELPPGMRDQLKGDLEHMERFANAVRNAVQKRLPEG